MRWQLNYDGVSFFQFLKGFKRFLFYFDALIAHASLGFFIYFSAINFSDFLCKLLPAMFFEKIMLMPEKGMA